ncbi:MAG: HAD family phosphatase [Candidatus Omnitrophica bacterium]|nr:HAD family phosphatase [Candidatus Omnitrophota bacterium]
MKHKQTISCKAVIFDMDGVITDTMPCHYQAWSQVFKSAGLSVTRLDVYKREGQKGIVSILGMCKDKKISMTRRQAQYLLSKKEHLFKKIFKKKFVLGSRSFVKNLNKEGFRLALVTGTSFHEVEKILPKRLRSLFEVVITGCDVRHGKPHPEPFRKALKHLRLDAEDAIVIENAPLGILSAKRALLRCFALQTSLPRDYLNAADRVFLSYKELINNINFSRE